jgi:5-methylcytosine-specific restriction enzyme A
VILRACLGPGARERCPSRALIPAGRRRCEACTREHQRRRDARRGTPTQRGYGPEYQANRRRVLADGPHPCAWRCGRVATTVDHVIALANGGTNLIENLIPCCAPCNASRGSRPAPSEWVRSPRRW